MSLVSNIGIGKQVFGFAYNLDFHRYKNYGFFGVDAEVIKARWYRLNLVPNAQEVQLAATNKWGSDCNVIQIDYKLHFQDDAVMMYAVLTVQEPSIIRLIPNFASVLEVYKDHIAIDKNWEEYKDRLVNLGIYKEIKTENGYFILKLNESY